MKKTKPKINPRDILDSALGVVKVASRYRVVIFVVVVALAYAFVVLKIENLNNAQPSAFQVAAQTSPTATAHVDPSVVAQLKNLQNNSVSVNALFNEERNNPFQENNN